MLVPNTAANGDTTKAWDILIGDPLVATSLLPIGRGGATHMALVRGTGDSSWVIHWQHGDMARLWFAKDGETAVMARNVPLLRDSMEAFCGSQCLLPDGRLLAMGGTLTEGREIGTTGTNRTAVFDATKTLLANRGWAMRDTMTVERWYGTSTTLGDGRVLASSGKAYDYLAVFGGRQAGGLSQDLRLMRRGRHAIWDNDDTQFAKSTAREGHSLSYVKAGDLYVVFGGLNNAGALVSTDSVSILQRDALDTGYLWKWNTFKPAPDDANGYPPPRAWHSSVVMGDSLFVFGGLGSSGALDDLWMLGDLHTSTPKWQKISIGVDPTNGPGPTRYLHSGVLDIKRRQASAPIPLLVLFGGRTTGGAMAANDVWASERCQPALERGDLFASGATAHAEAFGFQSRGLRWKISVASSTLRP